jgi:hypothetical protein
MSTETSKVFRRRCVLPVLIAALLLAVTLGPERAPPSRPIFITDLRGRSYNLKSVRIVKRDSGKLGFELEWVPRPYVSYILAPALSPEPEVALIRSGVLQIIEVP